MSVELLTGGNFKNKITNMSDWSNVTKVVFCNDSFPDSNTIDLSAQEDESIKGWIEGDTLKVSGNGESITSTSTKWMFDYCSKLQAIDLGDLDTTNVSDASFMFEGCSSLISLDLSKLNTENWDWAGYIFTGCSSLTTLNLENWNLSSTVDADYMFRDCSSLETIYTDGDWTGNSVIKKAAHVFTGCSSLPNWDSSKISGEYCKYIEDGGYFKKKEEVKPPEPWKPPDPSELTGRTILESLQILDESMPDIVLALSEKQILAPMSLKLSEVASYIDQIDGEGNMIIDIESLDS